MSTRVSQLRSACGWIAVAFSLAVPIGSLVAAEAQSPASDVRGAGDAYLPVPIEPGAGRVSCGLFVGVNRFDDRSLQPLRFAVHDAVEQAYLFVVELQLIAPRNCFLALSGDPSAQPVAQHLAALRELGVTITEAGANALLDALDRMVKTSGAEIDFLVVSICSHGFDKDGLAYIMPSDGRLDRLERTAVSLSEVEDRMAAVRQGRYRLLIVDACQERLLNDGRRGGAPARTPGMSAAFAEALERITPSGPGKLASCSRGQASHESYQLGNVGHGVFSYALLEALRGGARPDAEGLVRLDAAITYVNEWVTRWVEEQNGARPPDAALLAQSPAWYGPEALRELPLAERGGEVDALIARLRERIDSTQFTPALCDQLVAWLTSQDLRAAGNRELLLDVRRFADQDLPARIFVPFISQQLTGQPIRLQGSFTASDVAGARADWVQQQNRASTVENSLGMQFVLIPAGEFLMGSDEDEVRRYEDEYQHPVRLTQPYYLARYEVTQAQYEQVMGANPSYFSAEGAGRRRVVGVDTTQLPVEQVSWLDAVEFCRRLTALADEQAAARRYRLPTEAEWEFACLARGNQAQPLPLDDQAWCDIHAEGRTHAVGQLRANGFGLHDMLGNVAEWCQDRYSATYYRDSPIIDPRGPEQDMAESGRVLRGGAWVASDRLCRPAYRARNGEDSRHNTDGLRVVLEFASGS